MLDRRGCMMAVSVSRLSTSRREQHALTDEEESIMIMIAKDGEPDGNNDGVSERISSTSFTSRLISYLVDEMTLRS
jgi:hypothetical protein